VDANKEGRYAICFSTRSNSGMRGDQLRTTTRVLVGDTNQRDRPSGCRNGASGDEDTQSHWNCDLDCCSISHRYTDAESNANGNLDSHLYANTNTDSNAHANPNTNANSNANADLNTNSNGNEYTPAAQDQYGYSGVRCRV
jgi:hypothetical protein